MTHHKLGYFESGKTDIGEIFQDLVDKSNNTETAIYLTLMAVEFKEKGPQMDSLIRLAMCNLSASKDSGDVSGRDVTLYILNLFDSLESAIAYFDADLKEIADKIMANSI